MACIEIVNGPMELYWAPVGEPFPDVDVAPAGNWVFVGSSGALNYDEDGVVLQMEQTIEYFRPLGSTHNSCAFRTEQEILVTVTMVDLSLDQLRIGMNLNATAALVGPPATLEIDLDYGTVVNDMALLVRGDTKSPELAGGGLQVELNRVVEQASHELEFIKGEPAGVELEFMALVDSAGLIGKIIAETP